MQRGTHSVIAAFAAEALAARGLLHSSQHDLILVAAAGYGTAAQPVLVRDRHRQGNNVFGHLKSAAAGSASDGPCQVQPLLLLLLLLLLSLR
jgi:hypothetical protein